MKAWPWSSITCIPISRSMIQTGYDKVKRDQISKTQKLQLSLYNLPISVFKCRKQFEVRVGEVLKQNYS